MDTILAWLGLAIYEVVIILMLCLVLRIALVLLTYGLHRPPHHGRQRPSDSFRPPFPTDTSDRLLRGFLCPPST